MRKVFLIGLLQYWFVQVAFPQNDHYSIRNYSAVDGLPQSQVQGLVEDNNGYLWLGTWGGGIARFDGREFKVYTKFDGLLSNEVAGIQLDRRGNLWIHHDRGVTRYDGISFKKFEVPDEQAQSKEIKEIYESNDTIVLLSSVGSLIKIYGDSIYYSRPYSDSKKIRWVHIAPGGEHCFFMDDGSCLIKKNNRLEPVLIDHAGPLEFYYMDLAINYKENVLVKTRQGLFKLDVEKKRLEKISWDVSDYLLSYDNEHDFFWATNGNMLFKEKLIANTILKRDTILAGVNVKKVTADAEGDTWFSSDGNGLYKYFIQDFNRITPDNIRGVMSVTKDSDGFTWMGTMTNGIWRTKDGKAKSYSYKDTRRNAINMIKTSPDGIIWAASSYGLGKYDKQTDSFHWYMKEDGLIGYWIMSIDFDNKNGLWINTRGGLSYFDGKSFHNYDSKKLPNNLFRCSTFFSERYDALFIGTEQGLTIVKNEQATAVTIPTLNAVITSIKSYRDSLLVLGTGGNGVIIYNPRTKANHFITARDGIASDFAYFAAEDEQGFLWIGTEKGINHVKLNKSLEIVEDLHYSYDNGLTGVETNQNAVYFSGKEKYFGLVDGLYAFNNFDSHGQRSFDLHLTDVQILYGEYKASTYADSVYSFFKIPYRPLLPPDKNHVTFYFNRVDKRYPKSVKFKYYLENFDKAWSPPSSTSQVTYGNLPPGDYVFRVMATDNQGSWANAKIAYPFTVLSPFYRRMSFILGAFIFIAGVITLMLYVRVKQRIRKAVQLERIRMKEQENLRKEIARDFHDEMGNHLTRIINYISLLKLNGNGHHHFKQHELYEKVEDSAKHLYSGTRDFIWGIDPVNDELSKLFIHIRDFGEKLFEEKGISFRAFNQDVKEKIKLPYGFSREANLIFKEAMTNAFKHSEAKNITFSLKVDENDFQLILHDDGKGFYCGAIENSNGLKNIRERAARIKAVLRINSASDQGTSIALIVKYKKKPAYGVAL